MEDRKLPHLSDLYKFALHAPGAYIWFAIPSGMITGRPIKRQAYNRSIFPDDEEVKNIVEEDVQQLLPIRDVTLYVPGGKIIKFQTAMVDGSQVAAYGLFDPNISEL